MPEWARNPTTASDAAGEPAGFGRHPQSESASPDGPLIGHSGAAFEIPAKNTPQRPMRVSVPLKATALLYDEYCSVHAAAGPGCWAAIDPRRPRGLADC